MLEKINLQSGAELDNDVGLRFFFEDALIWRGGSAGAGCDGCRGSGWAPCGSWAAKLFGTCRVGPRRLCEVVGVVMGASDGLG